MKHRTWMSVAVVGLLGLLPAVAQPVTIDLVAVGNPGNLPDTRVGRIGHGSVAEPYLIGKYEVTAGQYSEFLNAVADTDTYWLYNTNMWSNAYGCKIERTGSSGSYAYRVAADWANRPVNYISWGDAARFVNWLHNGQPSGAQDLTTTEDGAYFLNGAMSDLFLGAITRENDATWFIPTQDEWYKAAFHKNDGLTANYFEYPTSNDSDPSNDLVDPDLGNNANFEQDGFTIGAPYWRTEVGEFENSESPYGTFDQGGNVWEWTETDVDRLTRVVRGGSWGSYGYQLAASYYAVSLPTGWGAGAGFRVATIPEPGGIPLLVSAAVAGLIWWKRRR